MEQHPVSEFDPAPEEMPGYDLYKARQAFRTLIEIHGVSQARWLASYLFEDEAGRQHNEH